jgi:antitoxin PrlF
MTIPVELFDKLGMMQGDDLVIKIEGDSLVISKTRQILDSLAGAVQVPKGLKQVGLDEAISLAKKARFAKKV